MQSNGFFHLPPTSTLSNHSIAFFLVGILTGIVTHEAGHAIVAALLRVQVRLISVGIGPILARFRVGPAWVVLQLLPTAGCVVTLPHLAPRRAADTAVLLAGVGGNAAFFAILGVLAATRPELNAPCRQMAIAQVVIVVLNLLPLGRETDGAQLLRMLTRRSNDLSVYFDAFRAEISPPGTSPARPSRYFPELLFCHYRTVSDEVWQHEWALEDAQRTLLRLLAKPGLPPTERALAGIDLITRQLTYLADHAAPEPLDSWFAAATTLDPAGEILYALRAVMLAAQGRADAARPLLDRAIHDPCSAGNLALLHTARAWVAAASGQEAEVAAALAEAYAADRQAETLRRLSRNSARRRADQLLAQRLQPIVK